MDLFNALLARRTASAKHLVNPGPSAEQIEKIAFAGSRAPDHGRQVPFRFIAIDEAARARFADVLEAAAREMDAKVAEGEIERAREKALQGPKLLALIGRIDPTHPKISASDQWLAVGCALENMVLAGQSLGFSSAIRSGQYLDTTAVRQAFGLGPNEHFTCFLAIGTASEFPPEKPKPAMEKVFSVWGG